MNSVHLNYTIENRHLAMFRARCESQEKQIEELKTLVREIPSIITSARMDQREGKQTKYDYDRTAKACEIRSEEVPA